MLRVAAVVAVVAFGGVAAGCGGGAARDAAPTGPAPPAASSASTSADDETFLDDVSEEMFDRFDTPFAELSEPERVFFGVWILEGEVGNGGFSQYYVNSSGDQATYAPKALRAIGAYQTAKVVTRANAVFGSAGPPADRDARIAAMDRLPPGSEDTWTATDSDFYAYPEDLTKLLAAYVRKHRSEIPGGK